MSHPLSSGTLVRIDGEQGRWEARHYDAFGVRVLLVPAGTGYHSLSGARWEDSERVHPLPAAPRVHFQLNERHGVDLFVDGRRVREVVQPARQKTFMPPLVTYLNEAAALGAAHGPCDRQAELANSLNRRPTPGHAWYTRTADNRDRPGGVVRHMEGEVVELELPDSLRPLFVRGQLTVALDDAFELAGLLTQEGVDYFRGK